MRGIRDPRAVAALTRSGESLFQKCFVRNSSSGPVGRGRGAGVLPKAPIRAPAAESEVRDTSVIVGGRGQVLDSKQQAENGDEWREAVQRRISLTDVQNRAGDGGATGRGRKVGVASTPQERVGDRNVTFSHPESDAFSGIARGRGIPVPIPRNAGKVLGSPLPGPLGAMGRDVPLSPQGSSRDAEFIDHVEEDSEVIALPSEIEVETSTPVPRIFLSPQIALPSLGRGRGQVHEVVQHTIGAELEIPMQFGSEDKEARTGRGSPPRTKLPQFTVEEARDRAIAILEEGIERNVAAEGERRRKAGMEKFADATEIFADKFKREPGQVPSQSQRTRKEKDRPKRTARPRGPRTSNELAVSEPSVEEQLTPEQEAELLRLENESKFKENLHRLFLVQFEPEYAMEDFGRNPDIDEPPVLSLEEYLHSLKPMFLRDNAELSEEQKWQEAVQQSLAQAPKLEQLVESYAGRGRMTARQQRLKMEAISDKLPKSVPPEVSAFTQRALITLQNNPGLTFHQKERLMSNLVSGFSSL